MFKEFIRVFFSVVRSPLLLLPALFAVLLNLAVLYAFQQPLVDFVGILLDNGLQGIEWTGGNPVFLLGTIASSLPWIILLVGISILVNAWIGLAFARFAAKQEEKKVQVLESVSYATQKIPRLVAWSIFVLLIATLFCTVLLLVAGIGSWSGIVGLVLLLLWIIALVWCFLVLALGIPFMGVEDTSIRSALSKANELVKRHFWNLVGFFIILGIVLGVLQLAGNGIADWVDDEWISVGVVMLFLLFQIIVSHLALPFYCIEKNRS